MAQLRVTRAPSDSLQIGTVFPIVADRTGIGRMPPEQSSDEACIHIPHHSVGRRHAEILRIDAGYVLADLGTCMGVVVNRVSYKNGTRVPLAHGDVIKLCDFMFVFEAVDDARAVTPPPSSAPPSPPA